MKTRFILFTIFLLIGVTATFAGPPPPPKPPTGTPGCWPPPCVPIDGGISLLIAAGALYGGKKLYNKHKENKSNL